MCTTKYYKARKCGHRWLAIETPCGWGKGFSNCETFDGRAHRPPKTYWAPEDACPYHDLKGEYDFNKTRMIESIKYGFKIGPTPDQGDPGVNIMCCVIL